MAVLVLSDRFNLERIVICYLPSLLFVSTVAKTIKKSIGTRHEGGRHSALMFLVLRRNLSFGQECRLYPRFLPLYTQQPTWPASPENVATDPKPTSAGICLMPAMIAFDSRTCYRFRLIGGIIWEISVHGGLLSWNMTGQFDACLAALGLR